MASEAFEEETRHGIGPDFNANPEQENLAQMSRWSQNSTPAWEFPPLAIANQYHDQQTNQVKRARYRLILVRGSDLAWLNRDRLQEVKAGLAAEHKWIPMQNLPFPGKVVLYAYAADRTPFPYACLQDCTRRVLDRLWHRPALNRKSYLCQVCTSLMDGGYIQRYQSPATYHAPKKRQSEISLMPHPQLVRNQPGRQKKKRETSLRQPPRIRRKMGQIQDGQLSAHVST